MYRYRKLEQPVTPPANPIGKRLADFIPANATKIEHREYPADPGAKEYGRSTIDDFDTNGDNKPDFSIANTYDAQDPQKLRLQYLMVTAPGYPYHLAGGESYADMNADGIIDDYSTRVPDPTHKKYGPWGREDAIGETWMKDTDFDGKVNLVGHWGSEIAPSVVENLPGLRFEDVRIQELSDADKDGLLDTEEVSNINIP